MAASGDQIHALLIAAEPYQEAYVRVFAHLGLREGELQHIRLGTDLNVVTWLLRIQQRPPDPHCPCEHCTGKGWKPKNKNGVRRFRIPGTPRALRASILQMLELHPVEAGRHLFTNPRTGRAWNVKALQDDFQELCKRAGVLYGRDVPDGITIHSLRHSCATNLVRAGVPIPHIAVLLGDTYEEIVRTYVNLDEDDISQGIAQGPAFDVVRGSDGAPSEREDAGEPHEEG